MNSKHIPNLFSEKMRDLNLCENNDDEVAATHPIKKKIGARTFKNGQPNSISMSKSMSEIRMNRCEESSSKTSSFRPGPSSTSISLKLKQTPSKNYTFNLNQMRDIERNNQTLMKKIMHTKVSDGIRRSASSTSEFSKNVVTPSATINRKKQQRQIDIGNDILQRKLLQISRRRSSLAPK